MRIDILTLFPAMFKGPFDESIIKRAIRKNLIEINIHNIRKWARDKHKMVDDRPFGGGPGMVLMVEPIDLALQDLKNSYSNNGKKQRVILLDAAGKTFNQKEAERLSKYDHLILIAGHYKGVDERIRQHLVDEDISIGDYILTGGEIPAMVITDAVVRLVPGVVGKEESLKKESFSKFNDDNDQRLLGFPQYTRPENYKGMKVPKILLSGDHKKIDEWRMAMSLSRTKEKRPDLLE
jgi:tRNA (guanine37-N1)-methyltransferase